MSEVDNEAAKLVSLASISTLEVAEDKNNVDFVLVWEEKSQVRDPLLLLAEAEGGTDLGIT